MSIATNRKAFHDFEVLEKFEAGLVLTGTETKSVKAGSVNLKGAFVTIRNNEAYVTNMHISAYAKAEDKDSINPTRTRKLLLHKKQIDHLRTKREADRLTIIPLSVFLSHNRVKLEIALARGKRTYEKRASIKKRDLDRAIRQNIE
ncbi:MAG: SsrA-binding protein SmpB [Patescibacteria group bacterium]|jgi:SsrA-binding protein